jgi:hypothetical protein
LNDDNALNDGMYESFECLDEYEEEEAIERRKTQQTYDVQEIKEMLEKDPIKRKISTEIYDSKRAKCCDEEMLQNIQSTTTSISPKINENAHVIELFDSNGKSFKVDVRTLDIYKRGLIKEEKTSEEKIIWTTFDGDYVRFACDIINRPDERVYVNFDAPDFYEYELVEVTNKIKLIESSFLSSSNPKMVRATSSHQAHKDYEMDLNADDYLYQYESTHQYWAVVSFIDDFNHRKIVPKECIVVVDEE